MKELFSCKGCEISVQERISKNGKPYVALIIKCGSKEYFIFKNVSTENTINNLVIDNLKK